MEAAPIKINYNRQVYDILERQIVRGILKPGQKLIASELASALGVSRSPVREAIIALNQEGLVENKAGNVWTVASVSLQDLMDSYEVRKAIEVYAARIGCRFISPDVIDKMRTVLSQLDQIDDVESWWKHNVAFHELIVLSSRNTKFHETFLRLKKSLRWSGFLTMEVAWRREQNAVEHRTILDAFSKSDETKLESAILAHITAIQNVITQNWQSTPPNFASVSASSS